VWLPAAGRIKSTPIKRDLPDGHAILAGMLTDIDNRRVKILQERISVVEPFSHT
jgi:hypothetical protein